MPRLTGGTETQGGDGVHQPSGDDCAPPPFEVGEHPARRLSLLRFAHPTRDQSVLSMLLQTHAQFQHMTGPYALARPLPHHHPWHLATLRLCLARWRKITITVLPRIRLDARLFVHRSLACLLAMGSVPFAYLMDGSYQKAIQPTWCSARMSRDCASKKIF